MKIQLFKVRINTEFCDRDQKMVNRFMNRVDVIALNRQFIPEEKSWSIVLTYELRQKDGRTIVPEMDTESSLDESGWVRYRALRLWRKEKAKSQNIAPFIIASNRELVRLAKAGIETVDELAQVKGFKTKKTEAYGEEIVAVLNSVAEPAVWLGCNERPVTGRTTVAYERAASPKVKKPVLIVS